MLVQAIAEALGIKQDEAQTEPLFGVRVSKHRQRGSAGKVRPRSRVGRHFAQMDVREARRKG